MRVESFDSNTLQAICKVIADTSEGLKGYQIGEILNTLNIDDPDQNMTKWKRLYSALKTKQDKDKCANNIILFLKEVMQPVRYIDNPGNFKYQKDKLNSVLAFAGFKFNDDGNVSKVSKVNTIDEAQLRANKLKKILIDRKVHSDVLKFCKAELIADNYFHAVFEATKSVADKLRDKTGLTDDGASLVDLAFGLKSPLLALNTLQSETEQSEQKGLINLIKGIFGIFRNTTAHEPKIKWSIDEQDALDLLTMVSYIHRQLDKAVPTGNKPTQ